MTTFGDNRERSRPPRESLEDNEIQTMADLEARIGPGRPLETSVADRMGSALGPHVRSARLHTDSQASEVARVHDAKALAVGHHVVLEAGGYRPGTLEGDALLAHELAHVSQQIGAANAPGARVEQIGGESREAEAQADLASAGAMAHLYSGSTVPTNRRFTTGLQLQRCDRRKSRSEPSAKFVGSHAKPGGPVAHLSGSEVDALLAASTALGPYISTQRKAGIRAEGRVFFYSSADFVEAWARYALTKTNPQTGKPFTEAEARAWVPRAFTADDGGIHIDESAGEPRTAIHESIHFYESDSFTNLGWQISEGFTEHFAQELIKERAVKNAGTNPALADPLSAARRLIAAVTFDAAAKAYFNGDIDGLRKAVDGAKGAGTFDKWKGYLNQIPPDFTAANALF